MGRGDPDPRPSRGPTRIPRGRRPRLRPGDDGGHDFAANEFNYATGNGGFGRQPGSSMKPFVLATALSQGISLNSALRLARPAGDPPGQRRCRLAGQQLRRHRAGRPQPHRRPRVSSNTAYAQLMMEVGPDQVVSLVNSMGIDDLDP